MGLMNDLDSFLPNTLLRSLPLRRFQLWQSLGTQWRFWSEIRTWWGQTFARLTKK